VIAPVVEEVLFRGILYEAVKQWASPRAALLGSSLLFAGIHLSKMTFIPLFFFALVMVALYEKSGRLIAPIVAHSCFNAVNFFVFIYQDEIGHWLRQILH
jgi:membrane protease YdiL (CAAX protease family)